MKKGFFKKLLLVVFIGIFACSSLNIVKAISSKGDLPVSYNIVGFNVFLINDKGMTQTQSETTNENIKRFPVEGLNYTTADEVKSEHGYTLVSTKLNVTGGIESLENIAENIASENKSSLTGGNNGKYLITFSVKYKLNLPDNTSVYDSDYNNVFSGDQKLLKDETAANGTIGLDQMLIAGIYDANTDTVDWNNQSQYVYNVENGTHTFTSRSYLMPTFDQYLIFTNDTKPADREIEDPYNHVMAENYGELYRYVMYLDSSSNDESVPTDPDLDGPSVDEPDTDEPSTDEPSTSDPSDDDNDKQPDTTPDKPSDDDNDKQPDKTPDKPSDDDNDKQPDTTPSTSDDDNNKQPDVIPDEPSDEDDKKQPNTTPSTSDKNNNNDDSNEQDKVVTPVTSNDDNNNNNSAKPANTSTNNSSTTSQAVSVPNTATDSNVNLTLSGVLLLFSGCGIVMTTKKEKENSK